jgi:crotonobetainyl-CoA:carnitine CoA-transferase CaiB-like acyl-CoA transferase
MTETSAAPYPGPLAGVRVLDFTRVLAGPAASLALADLGAEVIKIEPPGTGDETRTFPPIKGGESHYFLSVNRGKKSIVVDLKSPQGVSLVKDLAAKCDIVVENYRPGVMDRLGLGYEALSAVNPKLIYCAISGYGQTGPLKDNPSFDIVLQAMSGALSMNGDPDGLPTKLGIPLGDLVGGINGPIGILAALYERERTGRGRFIDVSLMDGLLGLLGYIAQLAFFTGQDPARQGSQHPNLVPYGIFPAKNEGSIVIACLTPGFWGRICKSIGREELTADPRYDTLEKRRDARAEVNEIVSVFTREHTVEQLVAIFTAFEVPHAPILGVTEALAQPQAAARGMVVEVEHETMGPIPIVNRPVTFAGQPAPKAPPVLGQHTDAILTDVLGLTADQIAELRASGAVS